MFYSKRILKNGEKVNLAITIEKVSENKYKITEFLYARNEKDYISLSNDILKNNALIYVVAQTFGVDNRLIYQGKRVKTCEIGTLTCYYIDDSIVIPCALIDEALDYLK